MATGEQVYTVEEVGQILKVSTQTVRKLIREKRLRTIRVGVQIRITQAEINRFLNQTE